MNAAVTSARDEHIDSRIRHIQALIEGGDASQALDATSVLLQTTPQQRDLLYLLAVSQRCLSRFADALATLAALEQHYPGFGRLFQERGHCCSALRDIDSAIIAYERAVYLNDTLAASWQALRQLYGFMGQTTKAANAARCLARLSSLPPELASGSDLLNEGDLDGAERLIRGYLQKHGNHIEGMRLLAQLAIKHEVLDDAELLLRSIVELAPDYHDARYEYAVVLAQRRHHLPQLLQAQILLKVDPSNLLYLKIYAQACDGLGRYDEALQVYRQLLAQAPDDAELHLLIGHALRTSGKQQEAIKSYRSAIAATPAFGFAYLGLANMKTYKFADDELKLMRAEEADQRTSLIDRCHLCFAIGKALEDRAEYAESFHYYERGNSLKRDATSYDPDATERSMRLQSAVCTRAFFDARRNMGCNRADPIFVLGLPRSGSTLIEQILASHSLVDGTMELPFIPRIAHQFRNRGDSDATPRYPVILADLSASELEQLGEMYIEDTVAYRRDAPFFVDKMPANFREIGLIHLILPNAKIIDSRRDPMACCFGNFKQLFMRGQEFSYSLEDLGRYYRNYVELMEHWDKALPGRVLRVQHEDLINDFETTVRRILDYCELAFEPACLEFYKTTRSVRTVSSEQVRRPIYRDGMSLWRNYEPWLEPLKRALGSLAGSL